MTTYMNQNIDQKKSVSQCKSDPEHQSSNEQLAKTNLYFHSILCNPHLLENPNNTEHSYMQDLFKNKQIKTVRKSKDYLSIDVCENRDSRIVSVMQTYQFQNADLKRELTSTYNHLANVFTEPELQQQALPIYAPGENEYYQWLNQVKNKTIIGWYIPLCEKGIKLRSFSMSLGLLNLLDYKIDDLALDIQNLGANSFDVIDGQLYKTTFLMLINGIRKFKDLKQNGDITKEDIIKQSETTLINQIKGRGNRKLTVQTKVYMASQNVICHEIIRVLDQKEVRDNQRKLNRETALYKVQQVAFNCLSKVAKLPKIVDPSNSSKICSYIEIKPEHKSRKQTEDDGASQ